MDALQPIRDGIDVLLLVGVGAVGWTARRIVKSIDGKLDIHDHEHDMTEVRVSLARKAEQKEIDSQFAAVTSSLVSVDTKLNLILSQMIRK